MSLKTLLIAGGICGLAMSGRASLVAHYKFDEGEEAAIAANEVPGSTTGEVGSLVTTGVEGISGNAYSFEGLFAEEDYIVSMGNASFLPAIATRGQYTFSAWVNTTDTTGNRNTVVFAGESGFNNRYADLGVTNELVGGEPRGTASARNRPLNASGPQQTGIFSDGVKVNDGHWHHLVMTVDLADPENQHLRLYVNGVQANQQTMPTAGRAIPAFNHFEIGRLARDPQSKVDPFEGLVDDVQIYDRALTPREVRFLHANPGVAAPDPPRVASLNFVFGGDYIIHFTGSPDTNYEVTKSTTLEDFIPMTPPVTATTDGSGIGVATVPASEAAGPRGFFRVRGFFGLESP